MDVLKIDGAAGKSSVYLDSSISDLGNMIKGRKTCIITDENVNRLHRDKFPDCIDVIAVAAGEQSKTFTSVADIHRRLVELEMDRSSLLIGIGGGVVTDLTGFAASTFLRGISFGFAATTVLAQVDAAIGGKNGVNLDGYKNLVGIIRQPEFVINATDALDTLPFDQKINGMAEVIKSGLIADADLFFTLEEAAGFEDPFSRFDMGQAISSAAKVKIDVVNRDVFEKGERRHLNLGHTLGHAIEKITGTPHGFGVASGMTAAAEMSAAGGFISKEDAARVKKCIKGFGLPVTADVDINDIMDAIKRDKKRKSDIINFVLLKALGEAFVEPVPIKDLQQKLLEAVQL